MRPDARADTEARAQRAVRRGELAEALALYESLQRAFPADDTLARRLEELRATLEPQERQAPRPRPSELTDALAPSSHAHEGERLFALGDYAGAAAAYRRALRGQPHSELLQERLLEIFQLAREAPAHSPTDRALPREPRELLAALLDRVAARRRG